MPRALDAADGAVRLITEISILRHIAAMVALTRRMGGGWLTLGRKCGKIQMLPFNDLTCANFLFLGATTESSSGYTSPAIVRAFTPSICARPLNGSNPGYGGTLHFNPLEEMMEKYIKIGSSILDNPPIGQLPDHLWRRVVELALLAAIRDRGGELPDLPTMAWYLRSDEAALLKDLKELLAPKISQQNTDGSWTLKIYNRFQQSNSSNERVKRYRERRIENGMGRSPGYDEEAIKRRDNHTCVYCEARANLCVDHVYPISQGGTDDYRNLACACQACNSGKAGKTPEQARLTFANPFARERYEDYKAEMEFIVPI